MTDRRTATLNDAPGCFGSPLLSGRHARCNACAFRSVCAKRARFGVAELKAQMGVPVIDDQQAVRKARRAGKLKAIPGKKS